jgi:hypothetical protein
MKFKVRVMYAAKKWLKNNKLTEEQRVEVKKLLSKGKVLTDALTIVIAVI